MSISTSTDIVLDVARAADPQRLQTAMRKLASQSADTGASDFATLVDKPGAGAARGDGAVKGAYAAVPSGASAKQGRTRVAADPTEAAYQALGGILLQKTFESTMPDGATSLFGKGVAGATWKSMLAQQMANGVSPSIFKLPKAGAAQARDDVSPALPVAVSAASLT